MNLNYNCLPCLINQVVKAADMTHATERDILFRSVFAYLSRMDFTKTNAEIIGGAFRIIKQHTGNDDPYREIRQYYNRLFGDMLSGFENEINRAADPFEQAIKYAIIGNIIDFNPIHNTNLDNVLTWFKAVDERSLTINHSQKLFCDLASVNTLLYLGDNCGEICLDKLLIKKIKESHPDLHIYFAVRGQPVVNDSIEEDAYAIGMDQYATIISNGDDSLGTVLSRTSDHFQRVYKQADLVIAKGQANYESLSEEAGKNVFYLLMIKCDVIAKDIGVPPQSLICMNR